MKLELFYYDQCPFCQIVLRKIKELSLKEKIIFSNVLENSEKAIFHRNQTGRSTVPCLYIDENPMFESADIAKWLEKNKDQILNS